jgi:FlgD Ig-like domain
VGRHAATVVVLLLLIGTAVAFAETERLKLEPTAIEESFVQPAFSPTCSCSEARAEIRLRLHRADTSTVRVVDANGKTVRVLVDDRRLPAGRTRLHWDGRDEAGNRAPDGFYRVDVHLGRPARTFELPRRIALDTVAPTTHVRSYTRNAPLSQYVRVFYRVNEPAHAVLYVNGKREVGPTLTKLRRAQLQWRAPAAGRYRLQVAAVDLAGNLGPRTPPAVVTVSS